MKIKRIINEKEIEIELTSSELRWASDEQNLKYRIEDIKSRYNCDNLDDYAIADITEQWKDALDNNDDYYDSYWETLRYIAKENGLEEAKNIERRKKIITIADLIGNGTELYNIIVATYYEGDCDKTNLFKGQALDCPLKFRDKKIEYIYSEHDYGNTCNYAVFEIEN